MAQHGPSTPAELAERTNTDEHYAHEWLNAQAAGSFIHYDAATRRYHLPAEHAVALTDETSPAFVGGLFQLAHGTVCDAATIFEAAIPGRGLSWGEHNSDVHLGCERFFQPTYAAHLVADWLPALDGVVDRLTVGTAVADVGCGHGASTILMTARQRALQSAAGSRTSFETADAETFSGGPYDLVTMFDCLHDMGDPVGAARHVREVIADDGTWMIVEQAAGDHIEDNLNPIGRTFYGFSTLLCTPSSLAQPVGLALGTHEEDDMRFSQTVRSVQRVSALAAMASTMALLGGGAFLGAGAANAQPDRTQCPPGFEGPVPANQVPLPGERLGFPGRYVGPRSNLRRSATNPVKTTL